MLLNAQGFVSVIVTVTFVLLFSWLLLKYVKDEEPRKWIKGARFVLLIIILATTVISLFTSATVQLPRTTIDRSAGNEAQQALDQRLQHNGEVH